LLVEVVADRRDFVLASSFPFSAALWLLRRNRALQLRDFGFMGLPRFALIRPAAAVFFNNWCLS
jgi:hypothetical protein